VPREELFITGKVWNTSQVSQEATEKAFYQSLTDLQIDYFDAYLIHWPVQGRHCQTYKVLEGLLRLGNTKAIGISNYTVDDYTELLESGITIKPVCNQIEVNPLFYRTKAVHFFKNLGIQIVAYRPMRRCLQDAQIAAIAHKYAKTEAQVLCRWGVQHGFVILPSSKSDQHIKDNMNLNFEIDQKDMEVLDEMTTESTCSNMHAHYLMRCKNGVSAHPEK
jgi:diketogulonate reductase-like aldo/keto reductase